MTTVDSEGYVRMFFMKKKGGYYGKEKTHIWLCGHVNRLSRPNPVS